MILARGQSFVKGLAASFSKLPEIVHPPVEYGRSRIRTDGEQFKGMLSQR